jgi:LysR family transcriptional regulator, carnitine catabolism transcriptional activator
MNLTVGQLRLVIAVAGTGSFTAAAEHAGLTQPALSRAVRDVERIAGVQLFERTTRSVTMTPDGREFVRVATEIVRAFDDGLGRFAAYRHGRSGAVTITALPSLAASVLPVVAARFASNQPDVTVRILDGNAAEVLDQIRTGAADVALTEAPASAPDLRLRVIGDDELLAVVPPDHALARRRELGWDDLAAEQFIVLEPGTSLRALTDQAFARARVTPLRSIEASTIAAAGGLVAVGFGVTAMTRAMLPLMAFARTAVVPLQGPPVARSLAVVTRRSPALSPAAARFARALATHAVVPGTVPAAAAE